MVFGSLAFLDKLPLWMRKFLGQIHTRGYNLRLKMLKSIGPDRRERFYSQYGEDLLLWRLNKRKSKGFYVDIGAYDGITVSNSLFFEKKGWSGLLIEPVPSFAKKCRKNRKNKVVECAVVGDKKTKSVEVVESKQNPMLSGIGASFSGEEKHHKVPALTLNELLKKNNVDEIDFISIDTEGNELEILEAFDFNKYRPKFFVIEENSLSLTKKTSTFLKKKGYRHITRTICNSIYADTKY